MPARVGLLLGDPCGIGPELVAKLLASPALDPEVATVVIGDPRILARAQTIAGTALGIPVIARVDELEGPGPALLPGPPIEPEDAPLGAVSRFAGKAVLDTFETALGLAAAG